LTILHSLSIICKVSSFFLYAARYTLVLLAMAEQSCGQK